MKCIIVEDNQQDLELLQYYVLQQPGLELIRCFTNGIEAIDFIQAFRPPLLFMDIDMPGISGIELFRRLHYQPACVFVTAHSEFALESYETFAFDFILKPCTPERLNRCVQRLLELQELKQRADLYNTLFEEQCIMIKEGSSNYKVMLHDILYIEALSDYSKVVTKTKKYITLSKLKHFLEKLPPRDFIRIHRSYAVARQQVDKIAGNELNIAGQILPVGKTYRLQLRKELAFT